MIRQAWKSLKDSITGFDYRTLKKMGIGKTLLLWFLLISLTPLATLSFINFLYYYRGLNILAKKSLFTSSQLRVNYLNSYFQELDDYLGKMSGNKVTLPFLEKIATDFSGKTQPGRDYFTSSNYLEKIRDLRMIIGQTWMPEGIINMYFLNPDGKIIFELNEMGGLGEGVFQPPLSSTRFSKTCKKILSTGKPALSDLEFFPYPNDEPTGFLGEPLLNSKGEKIGVLAIQISTEKIDKIVQFGVGFGNTGKVYIVGLDLKLRSASKSIDHSLILKEPEENDKTRTWQGVIANDIVLTSDGKPIIEEAGSYNNSKGVLVIGLYRSIPILEKLGVNWALVEEIDQEEAHAVARELSSFAKTSLILTAILVLIISTLVTNRFVKPIKKISEWAKQVAHGELISRDIQVADNEVGEMKETFNWLVKSLQSFAEVSQSVALGDYSKSVTIRSEKDTLAISMNLMVESFKNVVKQAKSIASGDYSTNVMPRSDKDTLGVALYDMTKRLREASIEIMNQDWLKTGINELGIKISGEQSIRQLTEEVITFLSHYLDAQVGMIYLVESDHKLRLTASFAYSGEENMPEVIAIGEGIIGQVAKERKRQTFFSSSHSLPWVNIGPDKVKPHHFIVSPIIFEGQLLGVIELGSFQAFDDLKLNFINSSLENISVSITTARSRERVQELLLKTQEQARELAMQKEELGQINQELEEQTKALKLSEENLQHQQEELRVINEELEERTKALELQRDDTRRKNEALEQAQLEIRQKAEALEIASRYKSEFLANMSHELRTPLNSILVLSELLAANKKNNMNPEEVEFATVINSSGKDLLDLINDILDLSKVEAGKLEIDVETITLDEIENFIIRTFSPLTNNKGIGLNTKIEKGLPESIETDPQRLFQIIKNLMSNAIKFTEKGSVTLRVFLPGKSLKFDQPGLSVDNAIGIEVSDTGIGISDEKLKLIFDAFQQADGTINRKFGGTGLGLTISRSLTRMLGGELHVESKVEEGSKFILFIPVKFEQINKPVEKQQDVEPSSKEKGSSLKPADEPSGKPSVSSGDFAGIEDSVITSGFLTDSIFENKKILIVDDDMRNVYVLSKILEERKVNILIGRNGREGIEKVKKNPDVNIVLMDIMMPEIDGYTAIREIRADKRFSQLPIIALTAKAMKGDREKCIEAGANDYLSKPVNTDKLLSLLRIWLHK
ncbi:MAG: response regulator [bacterium]